MKDIFAKKEVFLVGGPGGVGKTTLAAAMGIRLAEAGHRTVVLTVDPARRLAQALGFEGFDTELQRVELPDSKDAVLYATMLDSQRYFDKIIGRFARNDEQRDRILKHPLYRHTIETLGGTHEYAAMERLLEFAGDPRFDRIVVDTPPTQNAIDLLSAPQRLADFMDNSVLQFFQKGTKPYLGILRQGTKLAMKALNLILGAEFLDNLASFLDDLEGMHAGFRNRNMEVMELMRSPRTAFLLVSYPSEVRYRETLAFVKTLEDYRIELGGLCLNRLEPETPRAMDPALDIPKGARERVEEVLEFYGGLAAVEGAWVKRFRGSLPHVPLMLVARRAGALHNLGNLSRLGEELVH